MDRAASRIIPTLGFALISLLCLSETLLCTQPTAEEILAEVRRLFEGIEDYTVEVIANVDMPGLRAPEMRAKLYYKSPDKLHVESTGLSILPREGVAPDPSRFADRFSSRLDGEEDLEGRTVYRLRLMPKKEFKGEFETVLLVDAERFVVWKIEKLNEGEPFLTVDFEYKLVEDRFFLPSQSRAELFIARLPGRPGEGYLSGPGREEIESLFSEEDESPPKNGYATVRFEDYRINIGLADSLFEQQGQAKDRKRR
jgi:outer membrane lipoprotein-sorting protein